MDNEKAGETPPADGTDINASDKEEQKRPNAAYRLSKKITDPDELTFYYSRERRLSKASREVRELYAEKKPLRFSLFRPLLASKPRAMLFFSILILCAAILLLSYLGYL